MATDGTIEMHEIGFVFLMIRENFKFANGDVHWSP